MLIAVEHLHKVFRASSGTVHALNDINLTVRRGEFLSIVGPSGCGKSTLLNIVAGLIPPTKGSVRIDGQLVEGPQTDIGIVFQSAVLLDWRKVLDNVMLQIEMRGLERRAYEPRARALLSSVGLEEFMAHRPYQLSGGMQQRVAICRALIHDPPILLMDEPFGALDTLTREQMNMDLQRLWMSANKTVLFITHSIQEAVFLSDRVMGMTPRPGSIDLIETIELPRPRTSDMIETPAFTRHTRALRDMFRAQGILKD